MVATESAADAVNYTLRTNKRRNLTSSQWAAVAVEAEEILSAIRDVVEKERLKKQKVNACNQHIEPSGNKLPEPSNDDSRKTAHKAAELFHTNRTYINEAAKLKETRPDAFEKVKTGEATITQIKREIKEEQREQRREGDRKLDQVSTTAYYSQLLQPLSRV